MEHEVSEMGYKKVRIEKYNLSYIFVEKKVFIKHEISQGSQEIIDYIDPTKNKKFYSRYAAEFFDINMGTFGRYRLDGVPFGCQPVIVFIEKTEK